MDDLLADFVAETREMLEAIEGEIVAWEAEPGDRGRLDAIFRFVHTVKGNCGFFDFPRLEALSHAAESALAEVRAGHRRPSTHLVNGVLAIIDRINDMVGAIDAGEEFSANGDERLIAALEPDYDDEAQEPGVATSEAPRKSEGSQNALRSIRLPVDLLDRLMSGVSDMVLARNDLARRLRDAGAQPTIDGPFERLSTILSDVRESVTKMRMQRIEHLYNAFPRLVRDLSSELGKQVMIDLEGGDVELDREMIESIRDPLTHIIRNAIDHGIEKPAKRLAGGKREIGMLRISARQAGNKIMLVINDDGRGLDCDRICEKAVASQIVSAEEVRKMTSAQKHALIFEPGLSTAEQVSAVSGRGVGMDVVRANLEKVGGSIHVDSQPGEGTMFFLQLPLTLSIIAGLTVACAGRRFAIPRSYIEEIARGTSSALEIEHLGDAKIATFRGARVPCLTLSSVLGIDNQLPLTRSAFIFMKLAGGDLFALVVDRVLDNEDLVVKPLAPAIMETGLYAGSTLLDDGNPILMLDVPNIALANGLMRKAGGRSSAVLEKADERTAEQFATAIVFEALDGKRRAIRMDAVLRIQQLERGAITREGDQDQAMLGSQILPLIGLSDARAADGQTLVLRLSDGSREVLYAVRSIENSVPLDGQLAPVDSDPLLEGSMLLDGRPAGIIDVHALFARHAARSVQHRDIRCRIDTEDEWARTFLAPLVASLGYEIVGQEDHDPAEVQILTERNGTTSGAGANTVTLRSEPEASGSADATIYRYDRDGLIAALKSAAGAA